MNIVAPRAVITELQSWARVDVSIVQGDGWARLIRFKRADGSLINKTGYTFAGSVRRRSSSAVEYPLAIDASRAQFGEITISLQSAQTRAMDRQMVWDFQQTPPASNQPQTLMRGGVTVEREIAA